MNAEAERMLLETAIDKLSIELNCALIQDNTDLIFDLRQRIDSLKDC